MKTITLSLLFVLALARASAAQCPATPTGVVSSPTTVCFSMSPDHSAIDIDQPIVSSYTVGYCIAGTDPTTCTPVQTPVDIGKPTPTNGTITVKRTDLFAVPVGMKYFSVINVVGPGGSTRYPQASNPFGQHSNRAPAAGAGPVVVTSSIRVITPLCGSTIPGPRSCGSGEAFGSW